MLIRDQILIATGIIAVLVLLEQEPPAAVKQSNAPHELIVNAIQTNEGNL